MENKARQERLFHPLNPREEPQGFLSRMRANRLMEELGWHDMQLTLDETGEIVG